MKTSDATHNTRSIARRYVAVGKEIPMPSDFDEFTDRASPDYEGGTDEERANRDKLRRMVEAEGFIVNANEWWHFDYKDWEHYAIYDISFSEVSHK